MDVAVTSVDFDVEHSPCYYLTNSTEVENLAISGIRKLIYLCGDMSSLELLKFGISFVLNFWLDLKQASLVIVTETSD